MSKPRLAYAANRSIGVCGLRILLEHDWVPVALLVAKGTKAEGADEMRRLLPHAPLIEGGVFRSEAGLRQLEALRMDYFLSVHFPYVVPQEVLRLTRIGAFNLHPAHLPANRGWHTPTWAIVDGTRYGATLHWMTEEIDAGDIVLQKELDVHCDDTAHSLYQRVLKLEANVLLEAIPLLLSKNPPRVAQGPGDTMHVKADLEGIRRLNLSKSEKIGHVLDRLRALTTSNPDEAAYFEFEGQRYSVRVRIKRLPRGK